MKDLHPNIAFALKENRFINIRFAWDGSYTKKNMYLYRDGVKMLTNAGYKKRYLICFILSNYYVSLTECMYKAKMLLYDHIQICNCVYRKNYLDPKVYPKLWSVKEIAYFKQECRFNGQLIRANGYDSEIKSRLIRCVT